MGSASRDLIKQSSETLAGRISYIELTPFMVKETGDYRRNWLRGGFPKAYLADNYEIAHLWLSDYVRTFLEKDIPALGFKNSFREFAAFLADVSEFSWEYN